MKDYRIFEKILYNKQWGIIIGFLRNFDIGFYYDKNNKFLDFYFGRIRIMILFPLKKEEK
jgi:hypothetical protein